MQISMCALDVEQGLTQAGAVEVIHTVQRGAGIVGSSWTARTESSCECNLCRPMSRGRDAQPWQHYPLLAWAG